jgi:hypothetical protein
MSSPEKIKKRRTMNDAFLAGVRIFGIRFRHNSRVAFTGADGVRCEGWIVSVEPVEPEPIYTVELCNGGGDEEVLESKMELILDPHETPTA